MTPPAHAAIRNVPPEAQAPSAPGRRWNWLELSFWAFAAASWFIFPGHHLLLADLAILGLFVVSLDLLIGYAGVMSLGHGAFFGAGAYAAGLTAVHLTGAPLAGLAIGAVAAGALGALTGPLLMLRAADLTRLMVTLGVAMLLSEAANRAVGLTGGSDGLDGVMIDPLLGRWEFDLFGHTAYAYVLTVVFGSVMIARAAMRSGFGLRLRAIRDNALRAQALGVGVGGHIWAVNMLAATLAGVAGALLTQTTMFVSPDVLAFHRSADVLVVLVLGGAGWLYGGLTGAIAFKLLQEGLAALTPQYWMFWIGLILLAVVLTGRDRAGRILRRTAARAGMPPLRERGQR